LVAERSHELDFAFVPGRHAKPADLVPLAQYLGQVHTAAHAAQLHEARLDTCYGTGSGHRIRGFPEPRLQAIETRLGSGRVHDPLLNAGDARRLFDDMADEPTAFYKDTNPRNVLVTSDGPVMVDFDDLTLAPFGYDLAKLIVTLTMTHGSLPEIEEALTAYNTATAEIAIVSWDELMIWAEFHHILTSPYLGRGGYKHSWHELRPQRGRP
jgi:Ser/Thr protein kinase RdoA (MazF antagonist)